MTEEKKIRAFIAVKTPAAWDDALVDLQKEIKSLVPSETIRWIAVEQIHLTLRFLGYIPGSAIETLKAVTGDVCRTIGSFILRYDGLGCFPRIKDPRVIWAGLKPEDNNLAELHRRIVESTATIGEPPEERPFKPHLTLARVKNLERKFIPRLEQALGSTGFKGPEDWQVSELLLMQSRLSPKGASYEALHTARLA